jgi:cation transport protein ChaC
MRPHRSTTGAVLSTAVDDVEWLFGYGSVIYRPSFPFVEQRPATLRGFARRFSQASDDHRGTAALPGRVVTLREVAGAQVRGVAFRLARADAPAVFAELDVREQAGYAARRVEIALDAGPVIAATAYIAPPGNAWDAGDEPLAAIADRIAIAIGPSGANAEYLMRLAEALRGLGDDDPHVAALEREVRARLAAQ